MIKVVKVKTPISNSLKRRIQEIGAEIVEFLGRGGIIVSLPDMSIKEALMNIPEIKAVKDYTPKIDGNLQYLLLDNETPARHSDLDNITRQPVEISESGNVVFPGLLVAIFFTAADREAAAQQLQASHIEVVDQPRDDMLIIDLLDHPDWPQAFKMISNQRGLKAIEEERPATICVDRSAPLVAHGDVSIPLGPWNAAGEVIAIADTGLDTEHPDLIGQTLKVDNWADPPRNRGVEHTFDLDQSGHGTHVSGIAVGTGIKSKEFNQNPIQGIAAGAKLFFQKLECTIRIDDDEKTRLFIPKKIHEFLNAAYTSGARIHSNSWSHKQDYSDICFELDKFVWKHKDLLVVVAAGNQGRQEEHAPSHIAPSSITAPGTAKNCLTVGASENARCGEFTTTYGDMGFQHPPFNTQCIVDSINNIAAFSSRGPIEGQLPIDHEEYYLRYKPDVVAPGTFVLSTKSSQLTTNDLRAGSSVYPDAPEHYLYMSGTSMATPLVAGSAALVRQYLREKHSSPITSPSAALIKAIIIHSCQYLHYPYLHPASDRWVDNDQGWGRVNLVNIFNPEPPIQLSFEDQQQGMVTGEKYEYEITIADNSVPLKIMMVYTDFPGENLINNLNLTLRGPSGRYYVGNSFQEGGWLDDANNVEGIVVEQPETGIWQVAVIASEVIQETQDFALVASGGRLTLQRPVFYPNPSERQHLTA